MTNLSPGRFAIGLLERSKAYVRGFEKLDCRGEPELIYPGYFLIAHSCELALKAYLVTQGWSEAEVTKLSHRLPTILTHARQNGLPEIYLLDELVTALANANEDNLLRYPTPFYLQSVPDPHECAKVVTSLIARVYPKVTHSLLSSLALESDVPGES